jgi:hypothetical protein
LRTVIAAFRQDCPKRRRYQNRGKSETIRIARQLSTYEHFTYEFCQSLLLRPLVAAIVPDDAPLSDMYHEPYGRYCICSPLVSAPQLIVPKFVR